MSAYLLIDLFLHGFSWLILGASLIGFILVHYIWPKDEEDAWYDALEVIFDFPYRCIAKLLRGLSHMFKDGDIGIDL